MSIVETYRRIDRRFMAIAAPWVYLLAPGVAIHELAHAVAGQRYGDVEIDWERPQVTIDWNDRIPVWGVFFYFLAPLFVGGATAFAMPKLLAIVPEALTWWLLINWILLAGPSIMDVAHLDAALRAG